MSSTGLQEKIRRALEVEMAMPIYLQHLQNVVHWSTMSIHDQEKFCQLLCTLTAESKHTREIIEKAHIFLEIKE